MLIDCFFSAKANYFDEKVTIRLFFIFCLELDTYFRSLVLLTQFINATKFLFNYGSKN